MKKPSIQVNGGAKMHPFTGDLVPGNLVTLLDNSRITVKLTNGKEFSIYTDDVSIKIKEVTGEIMVIEPEARNAIKIS